MTNLTFILCFAVFVAGAVEYIIRSGDSFGYGVLAGIFESFIVFVIVGLIDIPFDSARRKTIKNTEAQISSLNRQLADNEKAYHKEMAQLNVIMEKVKW